MGPSTGKFSEKTGDTLVFSQEVSRQLQLRSTLMTQHTLNIQDRSVCLAVSSLRPLLSDQNDVLLVGSFSGLTVVYVAVQAAACSGSVLLCGADHSPEQRQDIQTTLNHHEMKNVHVLAEGFQELDVGNPLVQRVKVILLLPQCSVTASNDPMDTILSEHGDRDLLQDLCHGLVSQTRLHTLTTKQEELLSHTLTFPKVQGVVYCTRSVYPEENEVLVKRVLQKANKHPKLPPFRLRGPALSLILGSESGIREQFFHVEPSQQSSGCFISLLTREAVPAQILSAGDVLARAAAKGLMTDILPKQLNASKKKKHKKNRPPVRTNQSLHKSQLKASLRKKKLVVGTDPRIIKYGRLMFVI
ncbi:hypothetical protein DPEC_G00180180 [Dallia pectoralis]|uniref:Uncharacterized protein n=1 Tax=Dallia pectoralis TaxID=75939 RepID=A0ACC2GAE7_DALPE|nr:hypothetical protein DPEC_G00180180 [Dallia pectoralis]